MAYKLVSLALLAASLPAVTITTPSPLLLDVSSGFGSAPLILDLDNTTGPESTLWVLVTGILVSIVGPSSPGDVNFNEAITISSPASLIVGPAGFASITAGSFDAFFPPAVLGLHTVDFEVFFDTFDVDPIDPITGDLEPSVLAVGSGTSLGAMQLNVAVPEPAPFLLVPAGLAFVLRRFRRRG